MVEKRKTAISKETADALPKMRRAAARKARELSIQTGTPFYVWHITKH